MSTQIMPKIADLKQADLQGMLRPIGLPGLPYLMADLRKNDAGQMEYVVGGIESASDPMRVYSPHLSTEQVTRELFCNMPTPNMMTILRDLIDVTKPDSKSHVMTIFGDPSSGKSFMFKQVGQLVHPQGAIMVDCGGMNVRELFWRTIIDYGKGVQDQLNARAEAGALNPKTVELLKEEFPLSVVEKDGRVLINWAAIGERKDESEGRDAAVARAQKVLTHVYEVYEGLNAQSNAFGIKTVPGEILESFSTGRPLVLDEFTKCKIGSDDTMQTFLEFVRGDKAEWTTFNPMATSDTDSDSKSMTLKREDMRLGWFLGISGNEAKDGHTTHELSESMLSRLNPRYIGEMTEMDWQHRISQMLTGFPLTTYYSAHEAAAKAKPDDFGKLMNSLCRLGQTAAQVKLRPAHQSFWLQSFPETIEAVKRIASVYHTRQELANTDSRVYKDKKWERVADEIMSGGEHKMRVTSRRFMDDLDAALRSRPAVRARDSLTLDFDINSILQQFNPAAMAAETPSWYQLGRRLSDVILEGIVNDTIGMPLSRAALVGFCEEKGLRKLELNEAAPSGEARHLADLLKYDPMRDSGYGDTEMLRAVGETVAAAAKSIHPGIVLGPDTISLENIGRALRDAKEAAEQSGRLLTVPNDDLDELAGHPLVSALAIMPYENPDTVLDGRQAKLLDFRAALAALSMPGQETENLKRLWPVDIREHLDIDPGVSEGFVDVMVGSPNSVFNILAFSAAGNDGQSTEYFYMLQGMENKRKVILGRADVSGQLQSSLMSNNIRYVAIDDPQAAEHINDYIKETINIHIDNNPGKDIRSLNMQAMDDLYSAFVTIQCDDPVQTQGERFGDRMVRNMGEPQICTRLVKVSERAGKLKL